MNFSNYFYISETSPTGLRWKIKPCRKIRKDSFAGSLDDTNGYFRVTIEGTRYYVHRIIMSIVGENIEDYEVDHVNGNRTDNKIENLRKISREGNTRNRKISSNNSSGYVGIYLNHKVRKSGKVDSYWYAEWYDAESKRHRKCFKITDNSDKAKQEAIKHREKELTKINAILQNSENFQYTERHLNTKE